MRKHNRSIFSKIKNKVTVLSSLYFNMVLEVPAQCNQKEKGYINTGKEEEILSLFIDDMI